MSGFQKPKKAVDATKASKTEFTKKHKNLFMTVQKEASKTFETLLSSVSCQKGVFL
jgi:hypothetical protein